MPQHQHVSSTEAQTQQIARTLAERLRGGETIALFGQLGAGKTQFVKGLAAGLGVDDAEPVVSPTFVLCREYAGRVRLLHYDLYRLSDALEADDLGLLEVMGREDCVAAIEWPERAAALIPTSAIRVCIDAIDEHTREIVIDLPMSAAASPAS